MRSRIFFSFLLFVMSVCQLSAQDKTPVKFGKVSAEDFKAAPYAIDSSAAAVVISDVGFTRIVGNMKGGFSYEYTRHKRVHVLKNSAFDLGTVEIFVYSDGDAEEELENIKAVTYNLENGKVTESKLDTRKGVFKEKHSRNLVAKKFTMPDLREGCIFEYEYRIKSDFLFNLPSWEFQGAYPRLWSEYSVRLPGFIKYAFLSQGYLVPHIKEQKESSENYAISSSNGVSAARHYDFQAPVTTHRWVMKDVPELKEESFTSTLDNHVSKIQFQLSEFRDPLPYRNIMGTWQMATKSMMEREDFGASLSKNNGWLGDMIDPLIKQGGSKLDIARRIFHYVQQNFTATSPSGLYMKENLRTVARAKSGNVADINLMLTAMLRYADIQADPVILSTRSNGYTYAAYPLISRFNFTICRALIDDREWLLDAATGQLGFGQLSQQCYNGHARVVNEEATMLYLVPDSLIEKELVSVLMINGEDGKMLGSLQRTAGQLNSQILRKRIKQSGLPEYIADIRKGFSMEIDIKDPKVDSMEKLEMPVKLEYQFTVPESDEDIIYFNPMLTSVWKENPFKAANRFYPVEMPHTIDEVYLLRMDIPKGYEVEELPKQIKMVMNEQGDGAFEYLISNSGGIISMRSRLRVNRATFMPEEYEMLREFFAMVVQKQNEQIVFRKKP
ncbi:MAG: DUF3857 domain-containing protein [Chitinophagaceae bacterium]